MKYIKLFETEKERNNTELITPYLIYIKETDSFEMMDVQAVEKKTNPEFMALCYAKGWCAHEDYMTAEECAAVTDSQFNSVTNAQFKPVKSLEELKYFTGLTKLQKSGLWDNTNIEVVHYPNTIVDCYEYKATSVFYNMPKLRKIIFPDNMPRYWDIETSTHAKTLVNKCPSLKHLDFSNTAWTNDWTYRLIQATPLISLSLPKSIVIKNAEWAFNCNSKLQWMRIFNPTPYSRLATGDLIDSTTRFYVPDEAVDTFKATTNFSSHSDYIFPMSQWQEDLDAGIIEYE